MPYLLDTNVLLRIMLPGNPDHEIVRMSLRRLREQNQDCVYSTQNIVEFWNVSTRPTSARGGLGVTIAQTDRAVRMIERLFVHVPDTPSVFSEWRRIVVEANVHGVQVHDARIAAAMRVQGIEHILTLNGADFARYPGITAVHPSALFG